MRGITSFVAIAVLLVVAGWNANLVLDALVALYQVGMFRECFAVVCFTLGIAACVVAAFLMDRHAGEALNRDFPDEIGGIGAIDRETLNRQ